MFLYCMYAWMSVCQSVYICLCAVYTLVPGSGISLTECMFLPCCVGCVWWEVSSSIRCVFVHTACFIELQCGIVLFPSTFIIFPLPVRLLQWERDLLLWQYRCVHWCCGALCATVLCCVCVCVRCWGGMVWFFVVLLSFLENTTEKNTTLQYYSYVDCRRICFSA